jgi:hypothetical protein
MRRTVWFSLFCLVGVAVLASVRALSPIAANDVTKITDSFDFEDATPPARKTDRLVAAEDELPPDKVTIKTVKVVVPRSPATEEIGSGVSRKRSSYASVRGRKHHATHRH